MNHIENQSTDLLTFFFYGGLFTNSLSFRNYTPLNSELKAEDSKISTPADIGDTVEKKMEGVVEKMIQEEDEKRAKDVVSLRV